MYWFKLNANFDKDDRISFIEKQRNGEAIICFYLKLQCIAARCDMNGGLYLSEDFPHTPESISIQCGKRIPFVKKALDMLENLGLIEIESGVIFISDWVFVQSIEKIEKMKQTNLEKKKRSREMILNETKNPADVISANEEINKDTDIEIDKDIDIDIDKETEKEKDFKKEIEDEVVEEIKETFNAATNFPKIKVLSSVQRELVLKAVKEFGFEQLQFCFQEAGQSEFLNGKNKQGWVANFDWLIKPENIAKVLNGNYSKVFSAAPAENTDSSFELDEFINTALKRGWDDY